jgi:hypothetical protein
MGVLLISTENIGPKSYLVGYVNMGRGEEMKIEETLFNISGYAFVA